MKAVLNENLRRAVQESDPVPLLQDLVRTPSHPGTERQEEATAHLLARFLRRRSIQVDLHEIRPGRPNLVARLPGLGTGRSLMLCGHTDTVPPDALRNTDPFGAEIRDGRLYGRGACDMKGALASMASALAALAASGAQQAGDLILAAVIDEEMESLGAQALIQSGHRADGCAVGEPTENRVAIGHRGVLWLEVEFTGRAAHGGTPERGTNAIIAASRFVCLVAEDLGPTLSERPDALLGSPSINIGVIQGGDQANIVAARCKVRLDRRWLPSETVESVLSEIELLLGRVRSEIPDLKTKVHRLSADNVVMVRSPFQTPADDPLVCCALESRAEVSGRTQPPEAFPAWTDAALIAGEGRIPCVVMGPGDLKQAHSADEWVSVAQVRDAALQYVALALRFCDVS
ncbi:MAG: M20 family metallopeptidase [Acidobacteria bacterium]|nr:M20 family metallopeptidase [Acidobacteriota bacterium]